MDEVITPGVLVIFSYLVGSIPTGIIVARAWGKVDIAALGSGNIGATNVFRVLGKKLGAVTLLGDVAKGLLPALLGRALWGQKPLLLALISLAAFLGHLYPVYLKFSGGKGVATALGGFLGIAPMAAGVVFLIWLALVAVCKKVSLGSLVAALFLPVVLALMNYPLAYLALAGAVCLMIFYRHRENIARLLKGQEKSLRLFAD